MCFVKEVFLKESDGGIKFLTQLLFSLTDFGGYLFTQGGQSFLDDSVHRIILAENPFVVNVELFCKEGIQGDMGREKQYELQEQRRHDFLALIR